MRPTTLIPGRYYHSVFLASEKLYKFVRRDRQPCRPAVNIFQCDEYRGLTGPDDNGMVHLTDYQVSTRIFPIENLCGGAK